MTAAELVSSLESVRARGPNKYSARCPAHADKSPSLSIREGDDGRLLVHCFAGCTIDEITGALGLRVADLFIDAPATGEKRRTPRAARIDRAALAFRYELAALDLRLRAERVLSGATGMDTALWSDEERDLAMKAVGRAYADQEQATLFEGVAEDLRAKDIAERHTERTTGHDQHPSAA
jgi:hypothetical protein